MVDIHDLYPPNNEYVAPPWNQNTVSQTDNDASFVALSSTQRLTVMSDRVSPAQPFPVHESPRHTPCCKFPQEACISWVHEIVGSAYSEDERHSLVSSALALPGKWFSSPPTVASFPYIRVTAINPLGFLQSSGRFRPTGSPRVVALQAIVTTAEDECFDSAVLPDLVPTLPPARHPPVTSIGSQVLPITRVQVVFLTGQGPSRIWAVQDSSVRSEIHSNLMAAHMGS